MFNASPCPALATSRRWSAPTTWRGCCLTHLRTDPEVSPPTTTNPVGSDMTHTIPHVVNRLVIDTEETFDEVRQRYESLVPTIDFAELVEVIGTGDLARVQQYTAEHAPNSFVNF